jgi:hypothetical protein
MWVQLQVRHWDEPQKVTIAYRDGSERTYMTSLRDALLGALLDACRNVGNVHVVRKLEHWFRFPNKVVMNACRLSLLSPSALARGCFLCRSMTTLKLSQCI